MPGCGEILRTVSFKNDEGDKKGKMEMDVYHFSSYLQEKIDNFFIDFKI